MNQEAFMAPGAYDAEAEQLRRRLQYANLLTAQGQRLPEGQMVSGHYVAPSITQNLSTLLKSYMGGQQANAVNADMSALQGKRSADDVATMQRYAELLTGKPAMPAMPEQRGNNPSSFVPSQSAQPAQGPDMMGANRVLMDSRNPAFRQAGITSMTSQAQKQAEIAQAEAQRIRYGQIFASPGMDAQKALMMGVPEAAVKSYYEAPLIGKEDIGNADGTLYGKKTGKTVATIANPNKPFNADGTPNQAFQDYQMRHASAGAAKNSNTVINAGPKAFEQELGKLDAKQLETWRDAATAAQSTLGLVQNLRSAEKQGAYSGGGANAKLAVANLINGFTGVEPKGLVGSQLYNAEASKLVLDKIKMLGANPSNADREFIERTVPQLATSATARAELTNYLEKSASKAVNLYQRADSHARKNSTLGGFSQFQGDANVGGDVRSAADAILGGK